MVVEKMRRKKEQNVLCEKGGVSMYLVVERDRNSIQTQKNEQT